MLNGFRLLLLSAVSALLAWACCVQVNEGEVVVVTHAIDAGKGRVRLGDSEWIAKGPDAEPGSRMRVSGHDGVALIVEHLH